MPDRHFVLASGRRIAVSAAGDPASARLVVFCHPTPGASGFDPDPLVTNRRDIHLVSLDRPGYGASDPLPPGEVPTAQARADDIAEYLSRTQRVPSGNGQADRDAVGVVGWGRGGAVALSLAARHPHLVHSVVAVATRMPVRAMPSMQSSTEPKPLRVSQYAGQLAVIAVWRQILKQVEMSRRAHS